MKLIIKNKLISAGGSSIVIDEKGNDCYFVKGNTFSASKKKWVRDLKKNKLFLVRNKVFHGLKRSCLIYDAEKTLVAKVIQSSLFQNGFEVELAESKIEIKPSGLNKPHEIIKDGKQIGTISNVFSVARDTFELSFNNPNDAPFFIALVIAVDNITDAIKKH